MAGCASGIQDFAVFGDEFPDVRIWSKLQLDHAKAEQAGLAETAVVSQGRNKMEKSALVLAARAHHELTDAALLIQLSGWSERGEAFVIMIVAHQNNVSPGAVKGLPEGL